MWALLQLTVFFVFAMLQVASAQNDCGNTSFSGPSGVITSPNFPLPYPHNLSCTYSIDVGRNNSVLLKFLDFDLELPTYADNCTRDWLMITCNEANDENLDFRERYCGTDLPRTSLRFFNCPVVELKFFADSSVNGGGFSIEYTVFENSTSADDVTDLDCGDTVFTSCSGFIRFPSNPTDYSASVNCTYTISTDNTSTFSLGVLPLQLPQLLDSFADCNRDYIMVGCVSDGETELNPNTSNTYCRNSFDDIPVQRSHIIFLPSGYIVFLNCRMVKISIRSSDYNYRATDGFPFTVDSLDEECGTTSFTGPTGIVISPRFPLTYPHYLNCFYSIDVDRTKAVSLDSLSFNLEGSSSPSSAMDVCRHDWLLVSCSSDGSVQENPYQNRKYCGEKKSLTLSYTNCDSLTLNFVSDSSVTYGGFQFRYTITTAGNSTPSTPDVPEKHRVNATFTGPTGFITSPRFPLAYPQNLDYVYSIEVSPTKTVGFYFYSFNLEGTSHSLYLDTCNYDWLLISCVSVSEIHHHNSKYCGEQTMPVILSYSNCDSLTLNFISDSSLTSGGFKIWYTITSAGESSCGNTSFSGSEGVVTSPNFPIPYPHDMNCRYTIDVGRNNSILLKFKHFDLQVPNSAGYCENDWLMITCNETTKANPNNNRKFCGTIQWVSSLKFVDCSSLVLEFSSDSSVLYKRLSGSSISSAGFMIEYTVAENSNSTDDNSELECGATLFTNSSGEISFPRNPRNYLATVNCTYTISANQKSYIWFNIYLSSSMQLLQSFLDCNRDSLTIGCASEVNPSTTVVYCRRETSISRSKLVFADCLTLKLSIRSNTYDYPETFHIPFAVVEQSEICGNTSFSAPTGIVSIPHIPFRYSRSVNCLYTIDSGHVNSVALSVDRLFFGHWYYEGRICNNGWLTMTCLVNGTSVAHPLANKKLCGVSSLTRARFPACRSVLLNYTSDDISSEKGFTIRYRIGYYELDCGTTLFTNSSGVIILPRNPTNFLATVNCTYTIATNNLSYIWLDTYFSTTILKSVQDCDRENVKVGCLSEGGTELNPSTTRVFCRQERPSYDSTPLAFADCRTLKLSIRSSTYDNGETFSIPYSVVGPDEICGNTSFSAPTGVISSPRIPFRSSKCLNCLYTIDSGQVTSFVLSVDRLMLGNEYDTEGKCNGNWLTMTCLVNGTSMAHPLADKKLCGERYSIRARFPACRSVLVNFSSNDSFFDKGFTIRYSTGDYELDCGTTLFTNSSGVIILPRNPTNFLATVNCTYTIATNNLNYIKLDNYFSTTMLRSFQNCYRESVKVGCVSEGGMELNPRTTRVFCREESPSYDITPLTFTDCRTLKLSILSSTYDYPGTFRIPFTVFASDTICGNTSFSAPAGVISPSFPYGTSRRVNCMYSINSGQVNSVVLSVDRLQCGYRYYVSSDDWLIITCLVNGTSMAHPLAYRNLCGMTNTIRARFPACHRVVFNFSSNYNYRSYDAGFTIRYRIGDHELDCGTTLFANSPGVINLPRNPTNFLATVNCTYTISRNRTSDIWLKTYLSSYMPLFHSFQDCDRESLTIGCVSEGGTELNPNTTKVLCRREYSSFSFSVNQLVFIDCRTLKLFIRSRMYDNQETIGIPFTVLEPDEVCGNTSFSALTGIVSSPRLPVPYPKRINCLYVIESGHVNSVVLSVDHLNLGSVRDNDDDDYDDDDDDEDDFDYFMSAATRRKPLQRRVDELGSCNRGWLTITCLVNETSMAHPTAARKLCRSHHPIVARFLACSSVLLNFSGDYTFSDTRFTIRYRIGDYDPECGNTSYSGPNGFVTSPRFPLSYPHNLNCLYSIIGGQRHAISLSFISFRLYGDSYMFTEDDCSYGDSLTVSCLSDESVEANIASNRKYCGIKTTPLTFSFPSCALVVLNFISDEYVSEGGFKVRYTVTDLDIICGAHAHGPPSGTISLPWNYTDFGDGIECHYVINATEPSSISLTIWSISLQSSHGRNCHRDRLLINCVESQTALSLNVTHRSCDHHNSSVQLTFPGCTAIRVTFHGDFEATGKTFRIEYTITTYADDVSTTELPTTSISASEPVGTGKSCATGCEDSSDSSNCSDCLPDTSQTAAISISTDTPVTGNGKCGVGCEISADGTTCDCSTTQSDDLGVNTQMNLSGKRGRAVGISLTVIFLVAGAICLGAFLLFRRRREKNRSEMLLHASEEERAQMELEDDSTKTGSLFGVRRNQDRDSSNYLPLRPMSVNDHEVSSTSSSATEIRDEMQPGL